MRDENLMADHVEHTIGLPKVAGWRFAVVLAAVLLAAVWPAHGADTDFFSRHELYIDGPIEDILIGDADGDGLQDVFVFYRRAAVDGEKFRVAFFRQDENDDFNNTTKQSWDLPDRGGFFDLADVAGDSLLELVGLDNRGIFYYSLHSNRYDPVVTQLFLPETAPLIPPFTTQAWDFCWPLIRGLREIIALPHGDNLELWMADEEGSYAIAESLVCRTVATPMSARPYQAENVTRGVGGITFCLPSPSKPVSPSQSELFLSSSMGISGFRRDALSGLAFRRNAQLEHENARAPFFSRGPFGSGVWVDDLNGDGSSDLVRCRVRGGITEANTRIEVHYGPLSLESTLTPHRSFEVENITSYPQFADLDGDGRKDIILCSVELGTITSAKMVVVKSMNVYLLAYPQRPDNSFGPDFDERLKVSCRLDTEIPDLLGRVPVRFVGDLNVDGLADFVTCPGGDELEIYFGQEGRLLPNDPQLTIDCDSPEAVYPTDLNHDRKTDLVVLHHTKQSHMHKVTVFLSR